VGAEAKQELRRLAREDFAKAFPQLAEELRTRIGGQFDIHHRIPLDFAQLFPFTDINAMNNLAAIEPSVHHGINRVWREYARRTGAQAAAAEVEQVATLVERHFGQWYSSPRHVPVSDELIDRAMQGALDDLRALLARNGRGG
jgi:hypothetical protein